MTQAYSDPSRESDPHSLPDIEVFDWPDAIRIDGGYEPALFESIYNKEAIDFIAEALTSGNTVEIEPAGGYYWWACFPGCLPESDLNGPFDTEEDAIADVQDPK